MHYAPKNEEGTYEAPVHIPGAVSVALEAQGELTPFYADGIKYYIASSNSGYEGDLEMALIPDDFRTAVLKEIIDVNKVMIENAKEEPGEFALGFDIDGNVKTTRFWFYNCTATRPSTESSTNEDTKNPTTDKVSIACAAGADGVVRAKTTADTTEEVYKNWYKQVYVTPESTE